MLHPKYLFIAILFLFVSCKDEKTETPAPTPEVPEKETATPVKATFPDALFTEVSKVRTGAVSLTILDQLIGLINATPEGETIHLNVFLFDYKPLVESIKKASNRGVKVHVMMDLGREESHEINPLIYHDLKRTLEVKGGSAVSIVSDASTTAINHNKYVLFTKVVTTTGMVPNVVFQTSHNFTEADARKFQDAVMFSNEGLYNAFKANWEDMKTKATAGMKNFYYNEYSDQATNITAYFLPKRRNGTAYGEDSIIEFLNSIENPATATIKIGMSDWTNTRLNIVQKLAELRGQGATIEVVVKNKIDDNIMAGLRDLEKNGAYLKVYNMAMANIHSKFLLIEGNWKGNGNAKILITGSHNFTQNALRNNNEIMLLLKDHALFAKYNTHFENLKTVPGI